MAKKLTFEGALKLLQDKKFNAASKSFGELIDSGQFDVYKLSRFRQFKNIADQQDPSNALKEESSLNQVVFHMNRKEYEAAEDMLGKIEIAAELAFYLRSEMAAEQGEVDSASENLQKAVELNRDNVGYAKNSRSFNGILTDKKFAFLFAK